MQKIYAGDVIELRDGRQFCIDFLEYDTEDGSDFPYKVWGYFRYSGLETQMCFTDDLKYLSVATSDTDIVKVYPGLCSLNNVDVVVIEDETFGGI